MVCASPFIIIIKIRNNKATGEPFIAASCELVNRANCVQDNCYFYKNKNPLCIGELKKK